MRSPTQIVVGLLSQLVDRMYAVDGTPVGPPEMVQGVRDRLLGVEDGFCQPRSLYESDAEYALARKCWRAGFELAGQYRDELKE